MIKGIDVSSYQGNIDWKDVKSDGVKHAVLKVIRKDLNIDKQFLNNYDGCIRNNIPVDVYNYSYATTIEKAKTDANKVVSFIKGKKVNCVWLDVEDKIQQGIGMMLIDIINAYKYIIVNAGYKFGVYTGLSFYNSYIKPYKSSVSCIFWIARYPSSKQMKLSYLPETSKKPSIFHPLWGWQYSSKGLVNGIEGDVDLNIIYDETVADSVQENVLNGIVTFSLKADGAKSISNNFKVKEFKCKDGSDKILIDVDFVRNKLQSIRNHFAAPVTINSAYRTEAYNKKVGGASKSYHMTGQAFDIVVKGKTPAEVAKYAQSIGIPGIIQYNTFVHVDSRSTKYLAKNNNGKVTKVASF